MTGDVGVDPLGEDLVCLAVGMTVERHQRVLAAADGGVEHRNAGGLELLAQIVRHRKPQHRHEEVAAAFAHDLCSALKETRGDIFDVVGVGSEIVEIDAGELGALERDVPDGERSVIGDMRLRINRDWRREPAGELVALYGRMMRDGAPHMLGDPAERDIIGRLPQAGALELQQVLGGAEAAHAVVLDAPIRQPGLQSCAKRLFDRQCPAEGEGAAIDREHLVADRGLARYRAVALAVDLHDNAPPKHIPWERRVGFGPPAEHRLRAKEHVMIGRCRFRGRRRRDGNCFRVAVTGQLSRGIGDLADAVALGGRSRQAGRKSSGNLVEQQEIGRIARDQLVVQ